jgi:hypothetical protein
MMRYQVVDDNLRGSEGEELIRDLLAGKTVHMQGITNNELSTYYSRLMTKHQRRLRRKQRTVNGKEGYVVWLDPEPVQTDR